MYDDNTVKLKNSKDKLDKCLAKIYHAYRRKSRWIKLAKKCFAYAVGKQWDKEEERRVREAGGVPITIPKIQAYVQLLVGLQSQNQSDTIAYPEGNEDSITAEMLTRALKNVDKRCNFSFRKTEMFKDGVICGEGWIEAYLDSTDDLINQDLKFKKVSGTQIFVDPSSKEYDLSDANYMFKVERDLTKEQLLDLFPDKKSEIEEIEDGTFKFDMFKSGIDNDQYNPDINGISSKFTRDRYDIDDDFGREEKTFDLIDYYYKKNATKYYLLNKTTGDLEEQSKKQAETKGKLIEQFGDNQYSIIKRNVKEVRLKSIVGNGEVLSDEVCWSYPAWKGFPIFPFFARRLDAEIEDYEYLIQGIVLSLLSSQDEHNKRRTQEMQHLNQSLNSGFFVEKGSIKDVTQLARMGSKPGIIVQYEEGRQRPEKIIPTPLSQGHAQLAEEHVRDMKEVSGINTDLLAQDKGGSDSGRALRIRQQQGLVMVQELFNNLSRSEKMIALFKISQLSKVYDLQEFKRVLGQAYIKENFSRVQTVGIDPQTMQPIQQEVLDEQALNQQIMYVLDERQLPYFDVAVGQGQQSETTKISNFMILKDLLDMGLPPNPEVISVLLDESLLATSSKEKIKTSFQKAAQQAAQQAAIRQPQQKIA